MHKRCDFSFHLYKFTANIFNSGHFRGFLVNFSEKIPKKCHRIPFRGVFEPVNLGTPPRYATAFCPYNAPFFVCILTLTFVFINQYICDIVKAIEKQSILHFNTWPFEHGHPSQYCLSVGKHIIGYMICLDINLCMVALGRNLTNSIDKNEDIVLIWQCLNLCIVMQTDNIFNVYNEKHRWNVHRCPMATCLYTFSSISIQYRHDYSPSFGISFFLFQKRTAFQLIVNEQKISANRHIVELC